MIVFHSGDAARHDPEIFMRHGAPVPHPENAARYRLLIDAVTDAGHELRPAADWGTDPILRVHDAGYVRFLATAWDMAVAAGHAGDEVNTSQFARLPPLQRPQSLQGLMGIYASDTSTGIREGTWEAAYGAAQTALTAAQSVLDGAGMAYALCRPPGHHAHPGHASGFCFLNNAAIAVEHLRQHVARVAVLDIDVHHGDGTQRHFYARGDVLNLSVHAATDTYFPHFTGSAEEQGEGDGTGFNVNLPLAHGLGDAAYLAAIATGLDRVTAFAPDILVVSLGLDAAAEDPVGVLNVTEDGFAEAARMISRIDLPTLLVQEGGYPSAALQTNLRAFLAAFEGARESDRS